jgi:hypothetical protein
LFTRAGLHVHDIRSRVFDRDGPRRFVEQMAPILPALGVTDVARFTSEVSAFQYVVRASKLAKPSLLVQALALKPVGAVNDVRVHEPLAALATRLDVRTSVSEQSADLSVEPGIRDRLFLWQRPILRRPDAIAHLRMLMQRGYLVVTEFDDHPMVWPDIEGNDYLTYRGVHAVQTSTPALADLLRQWNPEVEIFPNAVSSLDPLDTRAGDTVTLFFGALNREQDWAPIMPALNRVLAQQGERVTVAVVHDRGFFDALETDRKTFTPTCGYADYKALMKASDVTLMPLRDDVFTRMKSDLKFIESAAFGSVALASPVVYGASLRPTHPTDRGCPLARPHPRPGPRLCGRRAHAGLSGEPAPDVVSQPVRPPRGADGSPAAAGAGAGGRSLIAWT